MNIKETKQFYNIKKWIILPLLLIDIIYFISYISNALEIRVTKTKKTIVKSGLNHKDKEPQRHMAHGTQVRKVEYQLSKHKFHVYCDFKTYCI